MAQPIADIITLQALTFLHPGTGQSTGVVDLPIQREVYSGHPMYASSGFKGSLRDKAEQKWKENEPATVTTLFGSGAEEKESKKNKKTIAGSLAVTDGRILAFPVRSLQKVFVWVTCPMVINRLLRDAKLVNLPIDNLETIIPEPEEDSAWTNSAAGFASPLILEELAFTLSENNQPDTQNQIAEIIEKLTGDTGFDKKRLVIIPDQDFTWFVEHATQVSARIKLNEKKTTGDGGNLWYEETLPPETIFYAFTLCHKPRNKSNGIEEAVDVEKKLKDLCTDHYLQIGGNETIGQGWCHVNIYGGEIK